MIKVALLLIIVLLFTLVWPSFAGPLNSIIGICINMFIAAGLAYVSYPILKWLKKKGINNYIAGILTIILFGTIIAICTVLVVQLIWPQIIRAIELVQKSTVNTEWIKDSPQLKQIYVYVSPYFDKISQTALNYIATGTQDVINKSTQFVGAGALIVCVYFYILFDADRIINKIKTKLGHGTKNFKFFKRLNTEYLKYLRSLVIIIIITCIEYALVYYFIGHPDWLALAALCAFANLVPYFGGIIVNIIALATSIFVSTDLFLAVCVCVVVLPTIEGNLLYPMIYKKTISISPIVLLPALFVSGALFGLLGIVLSIPAIIFYKVARPYYKDDIKLLFKKVWGN